ncbi:MAG: hypothetical protein KIT31_16135 [Deltaproteobacteria bacterium]|nr:hypothetical protein [Deltaproteobacteria bacterium]
MTWIQIAHAIPGRTRLRSPLLRRNDPLGEKLADELAAIAGIDTVRVRPYTGSVVIDHAPGMPAGELAERAAMVIGAATVVCLGERPPLSEDVPAFSSLAKKIVALTREIDRDIRRASDGSIDLGTLATLGFVGAGAAQVVASGRLQVPPWFNLAWWGLRTFVSAEQDEIAAARSNR